MSVTPDETLDCSGMACPMPIIKTSKAIEALATGQVLQMISTDAGSVSDVTAWTNRTGHELIANDESGGKFVFLIRKTG